MHHMLQEHSGFVVLVLLFFPLQEVELANTCQFCSTATAAQLVTQWHANQVLQRPDRRNKNGAC